MAILLQLEETQVACLLIAQPNIRWNKIRARIIWVATPGRQTGNVVLAILSNMVHSQVCLTIARSKDIYLIPDSFVGHVLHPLVVERLPRTPVIADVATGTGAWLLECTEILPPSTTYVGFDISNDQFPKTYPPSMSFEIHDTLKPFDSKWHGRFDVVNIRLLMSIMSDDTWTLVAQNVVPLLKPGGALVWFEYNANSLRRPLRSGVASTSNVNAPVLRRLTALGGRGLTNGRKVEEDDAIMQAMTATGLEDVVADYVGTDRLLELRKGNTDNVMELLPLVCAKVEAAEGMPEAMEEASLAKVREEARKEADAGWYFRADGCTIMGFRPEAKVYHQGS
jgi:SAM-dependent methyltransferase